MGIILLLAVIFIVLGVVLLLAGYLAPGVPPQAVSAGWGLIILGVLLLVIALIVDAVDSGDLRAGLLLPGVLVHRRWRSGLARVE